MHEGECAKPYVIALSIGAMYGWNVELEGLARLLTVLKGKVAICTGDYERGAGEKYKLKDAMVVDEGADM